MDAKPLGRAGRSLIAFCKSLLKERGQSDLYIEREVRAGVCDVESDWSPVTYWGFVINVQGLCGAAIRRLCICIYAGKHWTNPWFSLSIVTDSWIWWVSLELNVTKSRRRCKK
jgi:hypothetical protein